MRHNGPGGRKTWLERGGPLRNGLELLQQFCHVLDEPSGDLVDECLRPGNVNDFNLNGWWSPTRNPALLGRREQAIRKV